MFRCVIVAAAALLFALSPASDVSAGDRVSQAGPGVVSWSGLYIGLHAGRGWADLSIADGGTPLGNPPYGAFACGPALTGNYCNEPFDFEAHGVLGGAHVGFNWQNGNIVLGIEGELGRLDAKAEKTLFRPFNDQDFGSVQFDWYATLTGKLGYAADRALYYVKGGFAFARADITAADLDSGAIYPGSLVNSSETDAGTVHLLVRRIAGTATSAPGCPDDADGLLGEIATVFNGMVDQLSAFAAEVTRVAREVGTEGTAGRAGRGAGRRRAPGATSPTR